MTGQEDPLETPDPADQGSLEDAPAPAVPEPVQDSPLTFVDPESGSLRGPVAPSAEHPDDISAGFPAVERPLAWLGLALVTGVFLVLVAIGVWMVFVGL